MLNFLGCSAQGIAVANGAITLALLERMVAAGVDGVITNDPRIFSADDGSASA